VLLTLPTIVSIVTYFDSLCGWGSLLEYSGLNSEGRKEGGRGGRRRERGKVGQKEGS